MVQGRLYFIWARQKIFNFLLEVFEEHLSHGKTDVVLITLLKQLSRLQLVVNFILQTDCLLIFLKDFILQLLHSLAVCQGIVFHLFDRYAVKVNF